MEQQDLFIATAARDEALRQVSDNAGAWMNVAMGYVSLIPADWHGTAEDMRLMLGKQGCPLPHHHNAWGALVRSARIKGLLSEIGFEKAKTKKSHARRVLTYRRTWKA